MCGICGVWYSGGEKIAGEASLLRMASAIRHRGPDEESVKIRGSVGLAFRRLSIIDVSGSHQPLTNEQGNTWLVFNGEIYNFKELRKQLEPRHRFQTSGDGEVIIHAYEEWGLQFVTHLRGMFAFALWDELEQRLVLAVDRLGKKPLYYYRTSSETIFGSEPKAIFAHGGVTRDLDPDAVNEYLQRGYVAAPSTMFSGMRKLCPGELLVLKQSAEPQSFKYWTPDYSVAPAAGQPTTEEWTTALRAQLEEAVRIRLVSDVPLGAFLSGGLDSSVVVALMSQMSSRRVRTFSLGFADAGRSDESPYAAMVARQWNCEHTHEVLSPNVAELLPALIRDLDEPLADSSIIPTYLVSKLARQEVTVALSGDGGDEVFGGYQWYRQAYRQRELERLIPAALRPLAAHLMGAAPPFARLRPYAAHLGRPLVSWCRERGFFNEASIRSLLKPAFLDRLRHSPQLYPAGAVTAADPGNWLNSLLAEDVQFFLPGDILAKVDRCSMLSSLEVRSPLLDHQLFEFMATVPPHLKLNGRADKYLLRLAAKDLLPRPVLHRGKRGFDLPMDAWMRGPLANLAEELLLPSSSATSSWFCQQEIKRMLSTHASGRERHHSRLWALMCLELWAQQHL